MPKPVTTELEEGPEAPTAPVAGSPATVARRPAVARPTNGSTAPPPAGALEPNHENPLLAGIGLAQPIEIAAARREAPVFRGTVVIYLGSNAHKSVALRGQVAVTTVQDLDPEGNIVEVTHKSIPDEGGDGITSYDFTLRDTVGRLIRQRIIPVGHSTLGQYAGKPTCAVEHPDHLFYFYRARAHGGGPEFLVVTPPEQQRQLIDYFMFRAGQYRAKDEEFTQIQANATAAA